MDFLRLPMVVVVGLALAAVSAPGQPPDLPGEAAASDSEPTLPEIVVRPAQDPPVNLTPADDSPPSYPDLSQQQYEGLSSVLRSTRSVFDDPRATSIIDLQQLTERQPRTVLEALEREVGVLIQRTGSGQASPFIRGLTGPQTLILIDGVRLNNSTFRFGPNQYFATIDPGMIERIEVVRGPQSVLWGSDAVGGVINIVTRSAKTASLDYRTGEFVERFATADTGSYTRLNVEGSAQRWGVFGGGSYLNVNNLDRGGDLGTQPFTDYSQYAGDLKLDYLLSDNQMLTVVLQHHQQMDVPRTDKWPKESRRFDPQMRDLGYVRWQGHDPNGGLFDTFSLTASFHRQEEGVTKRKPPTSTIEDRGNFNVESTGVNLVASTDLQRLGRLTYGADAYHDDVDATASRHDLVTGAVTSRVPQYPDDSRYDRFGVFLQWDFELMERLAVVAGVRYSNVDLGATVALFDVNDPNFPGVAPVDTPIAFSFQDWTGSIGLTYELAEQLHLVGSISEGFRAPLLDEMTSVSDNVNEGVDLPTLGLAPETSISYEVGLKFNYERLRAQTFVFWTQIDGLMDRVLVGIDDGGTPGDPSDDVSFFQRRNVGNAFLQGVELGGEYLLTPRWSAYGNFTYVYGKNLTTVEPLSRIPPVQGVVGLRWRGPQRRNWFDVYGWLVARQDRLSTRDIRDSRIPAGGTPGYGTLNVRLGSFITANQRITLGVENILDRAYRVHGSGVDGPGISGVFGYELFY